MLRVHRTLAALHKVIVDPVFHIRGSIRNTDQALGVGFIVGKEQCSRPFSIEESFPEFWVRGPNRAVAIACIDLLEHRPGSIPVPRPRIPAPDHGQHVQSGRLRAAVTNGDSNENIFRRCLAELDEHVEIAIVIEDARIEQLVLELHLAAVAIGRDEFVVRISCLGILIEVFHVGMRRRRVEVEVIFLHVLAVVPLAVREAEQTLLEDGILTVPQGQRKAELLLVIGNTG